MRQNFENQLEKLDKDLTEFGDLLSSCLDHCNKALKEDSIVDARTCLQFESEITVYDQTIEGRSIKLIMKEQPVAKDLRYISSSLKLVTDMRRIGRQTVDISEIVERRLKLGGSFSTFENLIKLGEETEKLVNRVLECRKNGDTSVVEDLIKSDDIVDDYFARIKERSKQEFCNEEIDGELVIDAIMIAKYFERIGDHAVNIADWVYYSIEGEHIYKKIYRM